MWAWPSGSGATPLEEGLMKKLRVVAETPETVQRIADPLAHRTDDLNFARFGDGWLTPMLRASPKADGGRRKEKREKERPDSKVCVGGIAADS